MDHNFSQRVQLPDPHNPNQKITLAPTGRVYDAKNDPEWLTKLVRDARADAALARIKASK